MALATLLNVDYEETSFSRAGLLPESANGTSATTSETREEMMKDLWRLIHETCPGSIPPGMIFLPGPRLSIKGFGWAPKTWMSSKEVDFPDPLATMSRPASLEDRGLLVQYPGFLLHGMKTSAILYPLRDFYFAIDNTLLEWYTVRFTDEILSIEPQDDKDLAIILCRQRPGEVPEIALLVQIEKRIVQKNPGGQRHSTIFQSLIVCRVTIKRDITKNAIEDPEAFLAHALDKEETTMCGEILDDDQKWYVDGRCRTT